MRQLSFLLFGDYKQEKLKGILTSII